ncbi:MAG TPA: hypothetical protein VLA37_12110 [Sphingomonadaceae bacterium]|nr:hypothetical protein [Sphingomonadaceae bacterium]
MKTRLSFLAGLGLALAAPAGAQDKQAPLFSDTAPIEIVISGPVDEIVRRAERSTDPHPATLAAQGETHAIELAARGISRRKRETCRFPPLSIRFIEKPANESFFDMQRRLKLVTHCNNGDRFQQNVLKEYAAYRLYNVLTPESLRVRLARLRYMDDGKEVASSWGFLIEDIDDAADRMGGKELEVPSVPISSFNVEDASRVALFQYMIGNLDWAITDGPGEEDCCHNSKLIGADETARSNLTPVPYDFDYSGLVDAPYALPPESLPVRRVTQRLFRGFCRYNSGIPAAVELFKSSRPAMEAEIASIPGLEDRTRNDMLKFLGGFFEDIATPQAVEKNLTSDCD